jgi:hypothetical protein
LGSSAWIASINPAPNASPDFSPATIPMVKGVLVEVNECAGYIIVEQRAVNAP